MTKKQPSAGEWWRSKDGTIVWVVGFDPDGYQIVMWSDYSTARGKNWDDWHHEPLCTGWDWTPPAPIDPGEGWELLPKGTVLHVGDEFLVNKEWLATENAGTDKVRDGIYRRRKLPESPDDWVEITDPEHKLRAGVDQFCSYLNDSYWNVVGKSNGMTAAQAGFLKVRCRRRDLPVPQPNRIPVRLWHNPDSEDGMVFVSDVQVLAEDQEIKIGPDGFYVEGE